MDKEFINKISKIGDREFDRIEELVKEMLEFARPSPPNFREEKISKVVEDTIHLLEAKSMDKKITIVRKYKYKCLKMLIDANKIKQGLMNVIQNSIEAMPNGGTITIECERKLRDYIIKIKDAGKGMTKEDIKNVFLPFYTSGKDSGTGLGMAVTKKIIEDHEGKISIRSRLKKGTEILINIPIHTKQLAA